MRLPIRAKELYWSWCSQKLVSWLCELPFFPSRPMCVIQMDAVHAGSLRNGELSLKL